jgi:LytS/YehU family sensor histidine kinase
VVAAAVGGGWVGAAVGVAAGAHAPTKMAATTATPSSRISVSERFMFDFSSRDHAER